MIKELVLMLQEVNPEQLEKARTILHIAERVIFIGNGGSAAIASHMAIDYTKNGGVPALAFNDAAALTCLSNDFGYEQVFSKQIYAHCRTGDVIVLISSSGKSPNILAAVKAADYVGAAVMTLSGFDRDNPLRKFGAVNFYIPSHDYGVVEIAHLAILHEMVKP